MQPTEHQCLISVGSNIDPQRNIERARDILARESRLIASATVIETKPVGYQDQANFLNGAFLVATPLDCASFRDYLKRVEDRLDRIRGPIKSGPRTIDLDIVAWNGRVIDASGLEEDYVRIPVDELIAKTHLTLERSEGDHAATRR
ncbi:MULTISPECIES: 2-amino-4-hydroxy-6-hydroxymethyldihydropteridine diphosphokinase [Halomonadaceae]|uniref:2-amino-4-hydroxy-6-hydroxymethyldihydropteridine pyrophosphokinase n=1 Tax=Modicisalibacter zincidurans TaxID=1178777 RepID=A0ABP9QXN2_9GAMM|nr:MULTISPECIES: 2-amino-4-hydroxy-6-hydroxymethyldihydropteridine diphosphokinase [Halomonas]MCD6008855.1 2-amino-4-hydroxy-6-hydroxymethyldihydropteridine diphosphokinase [Halomonas sp. IOP_31]